MPAATPPTPAPEANPAPPSPPMGIIPGIKAGDADNLLAFHLDLAREVVRQRPTSPRALMLAGNLLTIDGQTGAAVDMDRQLVAADPANPVASYNLACSLAQAAHPEAALDALEHALDLGFSDRGLFAQDHDLDPLRQLPRFHHLSTRLR